MPVEYHILPAYYPNEEEKENPELFAENVRKLMADYLKIPLSDLSYEDAHLISKMVQYKLPKKCALIRVHNVKKKFKSGTYIFRFHIYLRNINIFKNYRINAEDIESSLPLFVPLACKSSGLCYAKSFADNLRLKKTHPVDMLFKQIDIVLITLLSYL